MILTSPSTPELGAPHLASVPAGARSINLFSISQDPKGGRVVSGAPNGYQLDLLAAGGHACRPSRGRRMAEKDRDWKKAEGKSCSSATVSRGSGHFGLLPIASRAARLSCGAEPLSIAALTRRRVFGRPRAMLVRLPAHRPRQVDLPQLPNRLGARRSLLPALFSRADRSSAGATTVTTSSAMERRIQVRPRSR
jgi:hypothetical protein